MRLAELIRFVEKENVYNFRDAEVKGVAYDSRRVREGFVFVCLRGEKHDGHKFAPDAVERGACAVVCQRRIEGLAKTTQIIVPDTAGALAQLAGAFWGYPSREMRMVGVTGTNGKTTTTYLCEALLRRAGYAVGVVGSISYRWDGREVPSNLTTPFSSDLQEMLASMQKHGCKYVVMEVSSHALAQGRVEGVEFDVAIFTNLTQDHLDFHKTMENYLEAKKRLFDMLEVSTKERKYGLVNRDDKAWREICAGCSCEIITYGIEAGDVRAKDIKMGADGTEFVCQVRGEEFQVHTPLVGKHNVYNLLAAIGFGLQEGLDRELIVDTLAKVKPAPGRFEKVWEGDFTVIVDYAHTPDAFENVLGSAREICQGRVIVVFGCGGNRDRGKRPKMGRIASKMADVVIITSDNPRNEDPEKIIEDILEGVSKEAECIVLPDREEAIRAGIEEAREGDVVMILGKGHETYQILGNVVVPFDDREIARKYLAKKFKAQANSTS